METNDVFQILSAIPIGTIFAWITAIVTILAAMGCGLIKLYKVFEKSKKLKDENDSFKELVQTHDAQLATIIEQLNRITNKLEKQNTLNLKQLRHSIVRAGEEALSNNEITIRKLKSLEEMFEEYTNEYHANGYVKTLMYKVRKLRVIGKLDENDEDIE